MRSGIASFSVRPGQFAIRCPVAVSLARTPASARITRAVAGAPFASAWLACHSSAVAKSFSAMMPASPAAIPIALLLRNP